ncbi:hypothetical protein K493DRAFT_350234 [Basidiobolus meristosporus CBS 931.73]|uniref:Uncharacterized protein n=1 Tax=Basidiobolus meristosporus CBS 931.73 TaxID=1314790 RepID=A0A1Y1YGT1_9FUNG|nr:hypothetical protein K493DRAFT_350234 [Basidiobolus meristosporus CBS 931.73]|eukprot:ORX97221.1 hypothetical protein K493DRAFT_350234 [Basidiobolus meristosporus CBS 931.73]
MSLGQLSPTNQNPQYRILVGFSLIPIYQNKTWQMCVCELKCLSRRKNFVVNEPDKYLEESSFASKMLRQGWFIYSTVLVYNGPENYTCTSLTKFYDLLMLTGIEALIIIYLTSVFTKTMYTQYKESPRSIYALLLQDGLIVLLLLCIFYLLITVFKFTNFMEHADILNIEWTVSSTLLTSQVWRSHKWRLERLRTSQSSAVEGADRNAIEIESNEMHELK